MAHSAHLFPIRNASLNWIGGGELWQHNNSPQFSSVRIELGELLWQHYNWTKLGGVVVLSQLPPIQFSANWIGGVLRAENHLRGINEIVEMRV